MPLNIIYQLRQIKKYTILFSLFPFIFIPKVFSQKELNYVPNHSFEEIHHQTDGHSYLDNVLDWSNIITDTLNGHYATPDHLLKTDKKGFEHYRAYFEPYHGKSCAGVITYMVRIPDYREYLHVKLSSPLTKGTDYVVSFFISNGSRKSNFSNIASNSLGIAFSKDLQKQQSYEPLKIKPVFHLQEAKYYNYWKQITYIFHADDQHEHLYIGNFLKDNQLKINILFNDTDPQSYFFVDNVSVKEIPTLVNLHQIRKPDIYQVISQEEADSVAEQYLTKSPVIKKNDDIHEDRTNIIETIDLSKIPKEHEGRIVGIQKTLITKGDKITIWIWDKKDIDGDKISLYYNGKWILNNYRLKKRKKRITLLVKPNLNNTLIVHAQNLGRIPPNTASIKVKTQEDEFIFNIRSTMHRSGSMHIKR